MRNYPEFLIAFLAITSMGKRPRAALGSRGDGSRSRRSRRARATAPPMTAGGVAVPLNALWKSEELAYALDDSGCKVLICDPERLERCQAFVAERGVATVLCRGGAGMGATALWGDVLAQGAGKPQPPLLGVQHLQQ